MNEVKFLGQLPYCSVRTGRVYDGKSVICCGYREINPEECISCEVIKNERKS